MIANGFPDLPDDKALGELSELFKMFADPTRLRILFALYGGEKCVSEMTAALGMTQPAVSYQLRVLKEARLVGNRREGKTVIYFPADDHVRTITRMGLEHLYENQNEQSNELSDERNESHEESI